MGNGTIIQMVKKSFVACAHCKHKTYNKVQWSFSSVRLFYGVVQLGLGQNNGPVVNSGGMFCNFQTYIKHCGT